jgi:hypothetical protein
MIPLDEFLKVLPSNLEISKIYIVKNDIYQSKQVEELNPRLYDVLSSSLDASDELVVYVR